jgi:membrane fusion protein (multidrug efflux system)
MTDSTQSEKPNIQTEGRASRFPSVRRIIVVLLIISIAGGATWYWRYSSIRESTDDAQIDGHLHPVSARISGTVIEVLDPGGSGGYYVLSFVLTSKE